MSPPGSSSDRSPERRRIETSGWRMIVYQGFSCQFRFRKSRKRGAMAAGSALP